MKYDRILLCIPPLVGSSARKQDYADLPEMPFTGIGYLAEFLGAHNIVVEVMDMRFGYSIENLLEKIKIFKPDLVGFTVLTKGSKLVWNILNKIKCAKYKLIVGGPHASVIRTKIFGQCSAIDYAIKLEGEYSLLELCKGKDESLINGLLYKTETGTITENKDRPVIENLDDIPYPKYAQFEIQKYATKVIPIVSSRGCPYSCIFCSVKLTSGRKYRARSAENVVDEIKYWYKRGFREFAFLDDNFTFIPERVYKFCSLVKKEKLENLKLSCPNGVRADRVDLPLLTEMKNAGFYRLCFGVESGNETVLKLIKKSESILSIEKAIKIACDLNYDVGLFFIVGLPGETLAALNDSIKLAKKYPINFARFYNIVPYLGTELYEWAAERKYLIKDIDEKLNDAAYHEDTIFYETPDFTVVQRKEALRRTKALNKEILKKSFSRRISKNKKVGELLAEIVYFEPIYSLLKKSYQQKMSRKLIEFVRKTLYKDVYHL